MRISDWSSDVCSSDLLQDLGGAGLLVGGFSGAPYKLYAVQAASAGLGLPVFIACSIVARGARFLAVALLAHGIARWAPPDRTSVVLGKMGSVRVASGGRSILTKKILQNRLLQNNTLDNT